MAHKTFISYKYSEAPKLRDRIIESLGNDASFYTGETSESPDLKDTSTDNIKRVLSDMLYNTSVTIVIISPTMKQSKWIQCEIEYSLKNIPRKNRKSHTNGVVGVIMKINNDYSWFVKSVEKQDGCSVLSYEENLVHDIINKNRFNQVPRKYCCEVCKSVNALEGSYISFIREDEFLVNPRKYIENAYEKSENDAAGYEITKVCN